MHAGDSQAISVSHSKLRSAYEEHRVETDPKVFEERVNTAKEVATLIRKHIVQGEMRQKEKVFGTSLPDLSRRPLAHGLLSVPSRPLHVS